MDSSIFKKVTILHHRKIATSWHLQMVRLSVYLQLAVIWNAGRLSHNGDSLYPF